MLQNTIHRLIRFFRYLLAAGVEVLLRYRPCAEIIDNTGDVFVRSNIDSLNELGDIINRVAWYLPSEACSVSIQCSNKVIDLIGNGESFPVPGNQEKYIESIPTRIKLRNHKVPSIRTDYVLLWDWENIISAYFEKGNIVIVDPEYYSATESVNWASLQYVLLSTKEKAAIQDTSVRKFQAVLGEKGGAGTAYLFVTGPSLERAKEFSFEENSVKIVCNSIVKNSELLEYIVPDIVVFADPVFHAGPSRYAAQFRQDLIRTIEKYDCKCVVPIEYYPLLIKHCPYIESNLIGMPNYPSTEWNIPDPDNYFVRRTKNILTLLMVPLATAMANTICILGADGREEKETYFWRHSGASQYEGLIDSAKITHPSFFRDRDYSGYYREHCSVLDAQITYGESRGHKYRSLVPSYIPTLSKRYYSVRTNENGSLGIT